MFHVKFMNYKVTNEIETAIRELNAEGKTKHTIKNILKANYGWGKTKCYETIAKALGIQAQSNAACARAASLESGASFMKQVNKVCAQQDAESIKILEQMSDGSKPVSGQYDWSNPAYIEKHPNPPVRIISEVQPDLFAVADKLAPLPVIVDDSKWDNGLEFKEKYVYNKEDDKYIFVSQKAKSGWVVVGGETVRSVQYDYTNGLSLVEVARKYQIPRVVLTEILAKLGVTHDSLPFTNEEITGKDSKQLSADLPEKKKFEFHQSIEKQVWKDTQANALKWNEFEYGQLKPFEQAIARWTPPKYVPVNVPTRKTKAGRCFVAGVFDWHVGGAAETRYLFKGKEWNIEVAKQMVRKYIAGIKAKVMGDPVGYDKCVILMGGDLYNTLTGFTSNGTPLLNDKTKDTQFDAIMDCLVLFINEMLAMFPKVEAHFVRGNHGGTTDYPLGVALKCYFRTEIRLDFNLYSCRTAPVVVNQVLILLDHGASDQTKSMMPRTGKAKESYVQHLLLAHPEWLVGIQQRLFIMGDLHHYSQEEFADFEFIQMGALVIGDQYSDTKNLHNRPRQNCLEIDDEGLVATHHIYVD